MTCADVSFPTARQEKPSHSSLQPQQRTHTLTGDAGKACTDMEGHYRHQKSVLLCVQKPIWDLIAITCMN